MLSIKKEGNVMHFILQRLLPMFVVLVWNGCIIFFVCIAADYHRKNKKRHKYLHQPVNSIVRHGHEI
jgi:hypothetical protein